VFLNPTDALHGDLGIVAADDVALLLSNSGETEELLAILPHLKRRGTGRIALVGRIDSALARGCDVMLDGSVDREVCPLNLAPTASTAVAMAIGDALAAVWMERAGISPEDFAINHPAGSLGRQLTLTVAELMVPASELEPLAPEAPLIAVIGQLTRPTNGKGSLGAAWVRGAGIGIGDGGSGGLITDGDLRRTLQRHPPEAWASVQASAMATTDPISVTPDTLAAEALRVMERNPAQALSVLPVIDGGELVGLLRLHDLVQAGFTSNQAASAAAAPKP
jgi:arabinose-5-phosphate isomerase